jgi:hypothetical protein
VGRRTPRRRNGQWPQPAAPLWRGSLRAMRERPCAPRRTRDGCGRSVGSRGERPPLERGDHVVEDERVPRLVGRHRRVEILDRVARVPGTRRPPGPATRKGRPSPTRGRRPSCSPPCPTTTTSPTQPTATELCRRRR